MDGGETPDLRTNELEVRSEVFLCEGALVRGGSVAGCRNILTKFYCMLNSVFHRELEQRFGKLS